MSANLEKTDNQNDANSEKETISSLHGAAIKIIRDRKNGKIHHDENPHDYYFWHNNGHFIVRKSDFSIRW